MPRLIRFRNGTGMRAGSYHGFPRERSGPTPVTWAQDAGPSPHG
jgi:hypothetical protein